MSNSLQKSSERLPVAGNSMLHTFRRGSATVLCSALMKPIWTMLPAQGMDKLSLAHKSYVLAFHQPEHFHAMSCLTGTSYSPRYLNGMRCYFESNNGSNEHSDKEYYSIPLALAWQQNRRRLYYNAHSQMFSEGRHWLFIIITRDVKSDFTVCLYIGITFLSQTLFTARCLSGWAKPPLSYITSIKSTQEVIYTCNVCSEL